MKNVMGICAGFVGIAALSGCIETSDPEPVQVRPAVGSSSDLSAFQGARAGQAENGLENLGYQLARTQGLTAYWFNQATGACARIVTADGRYQSVTMVPSGDC
ncbi:hypothetical protein [uncultured Maritimibacter sp.]|uniref:hypothetical protein n=1 Tax=uncultured Maritimibacter sp. TaxID=991866 RepID=UPI000C0A371E|nr:hypothetical protein [Maritimibacter sp.]|tara:strand:+ start:12163 stop:12471 length:309 start_codon:yes stop_codon:yes gene_type:complete